jgi:hypothetical protein
MSPERIAEARACYERLETGAPGVTLSMAVTEFLQIYSQRHASVPARKVFDSFLNAKGEASPNYQRELHNVFNRVAPLHDVIASDLEPEQIERALRDFPAGNRNAGLRYLRAAFNHGIRKGSLKENPIARLEFTKLVRDAVEIIPPSTVEKLLLDALVNVLIWCHF